MRKSLAGWIFSDQPKEKQQTQMMVSLFPNLVLLYSYAAVPVGMVYHPNMCITYAHAIFIPQNSLFRK